MAILSAQAGKAYNDKVTVPLRSVRSHSCRKHLIILSKALIVTAILLSVHVVLSSSAVLSNNNA